MVKKLFSILLALVLVLGMLPVMGVSALDIAPVFSDMPDNWARTALESAVENGLLTGYDGKIMPDSPLTRAQMATIIARAFGATEEADISGYTDVKSTEWYASHIAKAVKMGVMQGYNGKMDPESSITREQAFLVLARALKLEPVSLPTKSFEDASKVSDWAKGHVFAMINAGYIQGSDGRINPQANITRAEFAQLIYNIIKEYIKVPGVYTKVADGNIMVNVPGVTLKDLTVNGDLIVGDGVGDGELTLENVTIKGRLVARGGGANSIIIRGGSVEGKVVISKVDGNIRVSVEGGADVEVIVIDDGDDAVVIEGNIGTVEINVPEVPVLIRNATLDELIVSCSGIADITVEKGSKVTDISVGGQAEGTNIDVAGEVSNIETSAPETKVTGNGTVRKVTTKAGADGTSVTTPNTVITNEGASGVTAGGGREVPKNGSVTNNSGGSGVTPTTPEYYDPYIPVSSISAEPKSILLEAGKTVKIAVTVNPSDATNKNVTWSSSDTGIATVDENGVVTGIKGGTATITATSVADSSKKAALQVTVFDSSVPALGSIQEAIYHAGDGSVIAAIQGEFTEDLVINKPITLIGQQTTLHGTITITSDNVTVEGFEIIAPVDFISYPVIHMIGVNKINILNNVVRASDISPQPAIGTSTGPAKVTGTIKGNTVVGAIGVGTDGKLEVIDNTVTATTAEGIWFYPVGAEAELIVAGNKVSGADGAPGIKVENRPKSINEHTNEVEMLSSIKDENDNASVKLSWVKTVGATEADYSTIQEAVSSANEGSTILVKPGTYTADNTNPIVISKRFRLVGDDATIEVSAGNQPIKVNADGTVIYGFTITKTDKNHQDIIYINANNVTIMNNVFSGQYEFGDSQVDRAILGVSGMTGMQITGNRFSNLRQPAYFNGGNTGIVENNNVTNTRGWVVCGDSDMIFTGNEFGTNAVDIAIIDNNNNINNYGTTPEEIIAISRANNGAYVENQLSGISAKNGELFNTVSLRSGDETAYFSNIQDAVNSAKPGNNSIMVYPGNYGTGSIDIIQKEDVDITLEAAVEALTLKKQIRISGAGRHDGGEKLTIRGFTFDFSDASENVDIILSTRKLLDDTNNYAHNLTIEYNVFLGNPDFEVVAIKTNGVFGLSINDCVGIGLHSLGQIQGQSEYFTVSYCTVTGGESGINYYGPSDLTVDHLIFSGSGYGIRAGQSSGSLQDSKLTITNSELITNNTEDGKGPVVLRGDAPKEVLISGTTLMSDKEYAIYSTVANGGEGLTLTLNGNFWGDAGFKSELIYGLGNAVIEGNDV